MFTKQLNNPKYHAILDTLSPILTIFWIKWKRFILKFFFCSSERVVNMAENIKFFSPSETTDNELQNFDLFQKLFNNDNTKQTCLTCWLNE